MRYLIGCVSILLSIVFPAACQNNGSSTSSDGDSPQAEAVTPHDPSEMLAVGTHSPDFSVPDEAGSLIRLSDYQGKQNVVLIFYPGDDTPGCTKQLCAARDSWDSYKTANVQVIGVNPGSAESHQAFIDKYDFPFPILVDDQKEVISAYGCKGALWTTRTVYGVDKSGKIVFAERGMPETEKILAAF